MVCLLIIIVGVRVERRLSDVVCFAFLCYMEWFHRKSYLLYQAKPLIRSEYSKEF